MFVVTLSTLSSSSYTKPRPDGLLSRPSSRTRPRSPLEVTTLGLSRSRLQQASKWSSISKSLSIRETDSCTVQELWSVVERNLDQEPQHRICRPHSMVRDRGCQGQGGLEDLEDVSMLCICQQCTDCIPFLKSGYAQCDIALYLRLIVQMLLGNSRCHPNTDDTPDREVSLPGICPLTC